MLGDPVALGPFLLALLSGWGAGFAFWATLREKVRRLEEDSTSRREDIQRIADVTARLTAVERMVFRMRPDDDGAG